MKITEHIEKSKGKALFSFEILPPLKGQNIEDVYGNISSLLKLNPSFINVTYHREEFQYNEKENGLLEKKVIRKRPGTLGICAAIQYKFNIDTIPHLLCGGFTKEDTENLLIDLNFIGIDNVMALRGDAMKSSHYFTPEQDGHKFAGELVAQINEMNQGKYLNQVEQDQFKTNFCIGVAAYPEKHMESPSPISDFEKLKWKVNQGADYIITQMFYDNQKYFELVDKCKEEGINIPIFPGLKPITGLRQITMIPHRFHLDLPQELVEQLNNCKTNKEAREVGINWSIKQSQELMEYGVPGLHYFSMGKGKAVERIVKEVF